MTATARNLSLALLLVLTLVGGCAKQAARRESGGSGAPRECCPCNTATTATGPGQGTTAAPPKGRRLSAKLMSLLSAARAYHHKASLHLERGDRPAAIKALRDLLALDLDSRWPEAEEARLDAKARLAKMLLAAKQLDAALKLVVDELGSTTRPSFYLGNLHAVHGELLEARVSELKKAGKAAAAKKVARRAIAAFERSIRINKLLQRRLSRSKKNKP